MRKNEFIKISLKNLSLKFNKIFRSIIIQSLKKERKNIRQDIGNNLFKDRLKY